MSYPLLMELFQEKPDFVIDLESKDLPKSWIKEIQTLLNNKGFNAGEVDGIVGPNTLKALEDAKDFLYLQYPELIGKTTFERLLNVNSIRSKLFLPTNGKGIITSHFNPNRKHPVTGRVRPHRGIDIGGPRGLPIFAVDDGIVSFAATGCREGIFSCGGGFGNFLRIHHPETPFNESVYAHLQTVLVKQSGFVNKGQQIGTLGNTGSSTGPHLHFETWVKGVAINPINFFNPIV